MLKNGTNNHKENGVFKITAGGGTVAVRGRCYGVAVATVSGLVLAGNMPALASSALRAAARLGAIGMVYRVESAVVGATAPALPTYQAMQQLRHLPVAFVVNAAQVELYAQFVRAASAAGFIRAAFRCPSEAEAWVLEEARVARADARWRELRRARLEGRRTG